MKLQYNATHYISFSLQKSCDWYSRGWSTRLFVVIRFGFSYYKVIKFFLWSE